MPASFPSRTALAAALACAGLALVGWCGLLVPSLIRSIEPAFDQTDAGMGVYFFVIAVAAVGGSMAGGLLAERVGRRTVLPLAVLLIALGLTGMATVPTWELFLALAIPFGLGMGAIDGGMNGLVLDLYPENRGRALNILHLFFSLGALASPLVIGRFVEAGATWQAVLIGTAVAAVPIAVLFVVVPLPSGRHARADASGGARVGLALPIILLAVAIACYVASEIGVSNWLVRFLETASIGLATYALALFWGSLALGRLVTATLGDRFDHARFAAIASLVAAIALVAAVLVPSLPASIVLFGVVGFAFGPVYPLIMAVAGDLYPTRSAAVSGFLAGSAVAGAIVYPPLMGFISVEAGLTVAMLGAAVLSFACGLVLFAVGWRSSRLDLADQE